MRNKIKFLLKTNGITIRKVSRFSKKEIVFLHIGKNAGSHYSKLAALLNQKQNRTYFRVTPHHTTLTDLPDHVDYIFSVRDPISRFVSAFYSRQRQGKPLYNNVWTDAEQAAFTTFQHANDLAEALNPKHPEFRDAFFAMTSIGHLNTNQKDWINGSNQFLATRPPLYIFRQETFNSDCIDFLTSLALPKTIHEAGIASLTDPTHKNDYSTATPLSDVAKLNLQKWYHQDYLFLQMCDEWRQNL